MHEQSQPHQAGRSGTKDITVSQDTGLTRPTLRCAAAEFNCRSKLPKMHGYISA